MSCKADLGHWYGKIIVDGMARMIDERGRKYMEKVESSGLGKIIRGCLR